MISPSASLLRRATDQFGPPKSARPDVSYTTGWDVTVFVTRLHDVDPPGGAIDGDEQVLATILTG
jgi:hypothetical protein